MYGKRERERGREQTSPGGILQNFGRNLTCFDIRETKIQYLCKNFASIRAASTYTFVVGYKMSFFLPPPFLISPIFCQRRRYSKWHLQPLHPVGALVLGLWEETHVPKVVGSNPGAIYRMYITFFHIDWL